MRLTIILSLFILSPIVLADCDLTTDLWQSTVNAADSQGIEPHLLLALFWVESRWCHEGLTEEGITESPKGALGIGQIMPSTAEDLDIDPYEIEENIIGAARYLREQWDVFEDWELALAAYNAGAQAVKDNDGIPPFEETKEYVVAVLNAYEDFLDREELELPEIGESITITVPVEENNMEEVVSIAPTTSSMGLEMLSSIDGVLYVLVPTGNARTPYEGAYLLPQTDVHGNTVYIMLSAPDSIQEEPQVEEAGLLNPGVITFTTNADDGIANDISQAGKVTLTRIGNSTTNNE